MIRTVGELVDALSNYPAEMAVGVYDSTSEEGGVFVAELVVQRRDPNGRHNQSGLYYKADSPFFYEPDLAEFLTIVGR